MCFSLSSSAVGVPIPYRHGDWRWLPLAAMMMVLLMYGCEKQSGGAIDPTGSPPFMSWASATPDSLRMTSLPPITGLLQATIDARAKIIASPGETGTITVSVDVIASGTSDPFLTVLLHDDGMQPDSTSGDGIYSARIVFLIAKSASGIYTLRYSAIDRQGFASNMIEKPLYLIRPSHPPVLSNLDAPDTVTLPVGGSVAIDMYVRATDPDGQSDISQVYWRSLDASDPNFRYIMQNDGSAPGSVPGDSTYAFHLPIADPIPRKTFRFAFQAVNNLGDTSATILHLITIKSPP